MSARRVAIIDSGGANIASLRFALDRLAVDSILTADASEIRSASHVILPGVGAASNAMARLRRQQLDTVIPALQQPVLGICLGMQLLAEKSEEDNATCLGILPGTVAHLSASAEHPVPNMGWCRTRNLSASALFQGIDSGAWFYFLHSYALPVDDHSTATAEHATPFSAAFSKRNFHATQFHPERSAGSGARLLRNFLDMS